MTPPLSHVAGKRLLPFVLAHPFGEHAVFIMSWKTKVESVDTLHFGHFRNPFSFHFLLSQEDAVLYKWLEQNGLIAANFFCEKCGKPCKVVSAKSRKGGKIWRCRGSATWKHETNYSSHKFSIFEGVHFDVRELLVFVREWLLGSSLHRCAIQSGMDYKKSAVEWVNFLRDHCRKFVHDLYYGEEEKLRGEIEIDESLFGRRTKYHRGDPRGLKIWIFGMVERSSNRLILYPVERRDETTLIPLIERHVEKGSTIYSDGWQAYSSLNSRGYHHFTVEHKHTFVQRYRNTSTGAEKVVHTNTIEGSWKISKDHFRRINGCKITTFESHLCEVIWRNRVVVNRNDVISAFFNLVREHYSLRRKPDLEMRVPLFDSWHVTEGEKVMREEDGNPVDTSVQSDVTVKSTSHSLPSVSSDEAGPSTSRPTAHTRNVAPTLASDPVAKRVHSPPASSSTTWTVKGKNGENNSKGKGKKMRTSSASSSRLRHPEGYLAIHAKKGSTTSEKKINPYSKSNFVLNWSSSDSDFQ
ncbi:uncharacterized protein [Diadema antillarum]|uniref:uncharacterized protein n=1 Tax=Diadema antillarum TaxID=105358 RepID=UPI003A84193F